MQRLFYFLVVFNLAAGFWSVYAILATEFCRWRERRTHDSRSVEPVTVRELPQVAAKREAAAMRGYDSPQLFRQASLIRIRELEREIVQDLREIERRKEQK
jgi:hypothetical protein